MSKKGIILAAVLVMVAVATAVLLKDGTQKADKNATIRYIKAGHPVIACEDAFWLLDKNLAMINEKMIQLEKFESESGEGLTQETYLDMHNEMLDNVTPSQADITLWHDEVILAIADLFKNRPEDQIQVGNAVGSQFVQIYQTAMAITLGLMDEGEVRTALEEQFCTGDVH